MDEMVLKTQKWLNQTYGNDSRYNYVSEDGQTGWKTIYGLIRALQIELGISVTADNFGPSTQAKFSARWPNGIVQQADEAPEEDNVYAIIQGALWCKGYSTGNYEITRHFYSGTGGAVIALKSDALGIDIMPHNSTVTLNLMIALLSMNQYVLLDSLGGTEAIRTIQQTLNREYEAYVGLMPTDGLYGREMNKALIKVLQAIEGLSPSEANGNFGPTTKSLCPIIPPDDNTEAIKLLKYALICNGTALFDTNDTWSVILQHEVQVFQDQMKIPVTGVADLNTWMSLLLSSGNPERNATVCDTRFEITDQRADQLIEKGYTIVGRYLTGGEFKELREDEPSRILAKGLKFFPIFQESGTDLSYFTYERGLADGIKAGNAAQKFKLPLNTIIYFAVDTDVLDGDIASYILPYFYGVYINLDNKYKVGIYGTRNVCTQVLKKGYAKTCFVSDMSTGYSGNMGFKMPSNWNYDQFAEISMEPDWAIDKVGYSGRYPAVEALESGATSYTYSEIADKIQEVEAAYKEYYDMCFSLDPGNLPVFSGKISILGVTNYLRSQNYSDWKWSITTGRGIDEGFVEDMNTHYSDLAAWLNPLIGLAPQCFIDNYGGEMDLAHLAATTECYISSVLDKTWAGWVGDLATGMGEVQAVIDEYPDMEARQLAQKIVGAKYNSSCNYSDLCCDADAIKIAELSQGYLNTDNPLSNALREYYTSYCQNRYTYYLYDLGLSLDDSLSLEALKEKIYEVENRKQPLEGYEAGVSAVQLLNINRIPEDSINRVCCDVLAEYIFNRI